MSLPISYSLRNVRARLRRTGLTIAVIALAVIATAVFLALLSILHARCVPRVAETSWGCGMARQTAPSI